MSSTVSPGPNAAASPRPSATGRCAASSSRTNRIAADEVLPTWRMTRWVACDLSLTQPETSDHGIDDRLAAGVQRDDIEVGCVTDELTDEGGEVGLEEPGQLARHHDPETVVGAFEAERVDARCDQLMTRPADPDAAGDRSGAEHRRAGAITEDEHAQQVVGGGIGRPERQRRHLDRNHQRRLIAMGAHPVGRPAECRRAAGTPEVHERHAPDIAAEAEMVDQLHVDAREHEPGARRHNDQPDVRDRRARIQDRSLRGRDGEWCGLRRVPNRLLPGAERHQGFVDRAHQEAMRAGEFVGEQAHAAREPRPHLCDQAQHLVAVDLVRRYRRAEPVDGDRRQDRPPRAAIGQRRGADRRLNNHALGS